MRSLEIDLNPSELAQFLEKPAKDFTLSRSSSRQTFEYRVADGSADIYLTLAALVVTAMRGLKMPGALELEKT